MALHNHGNLHLHPHVPMPPSGTTFDPPSKRASGSSSKCTPGKPHCEYPTDNSATLPIVLGVLIPLGFVVVAILYLTRRNRLRQKREDAEYKHASLDFGLGEVQRPSNGRKGKKGAPAEPKPMDLDAEREFRQNRGLSMDMLSSPYVLASDLDDSRPSFQSLSRSATDIEDPYRPITLVRADSANGNYPSRPPSRKDSASLFTQSSEGGTSRANLVRTTSNAAASPLAEEPLGPTFMTTAPAPSLQPTQPVPARKPVATDPPFPHEPQVHAEPTQAQISDQPPQLSLPLDLPPRLSSTSATMHTDLAFAPDSSGFVLANNYPTIQVTPTQPEEDLPPSPPPKFNSMPPPTDMRRANSVEADDEYETYADVLGIVQKESTAQYEDQSEEQMQGLGVHGFDYDARRLSASIRPLPPDDITDNPETRANRIRSFYREYFDESSKRDTAMGWGYGGGGAEYYEDYGQEYLDGATVFDPETGQFIIAPNAPFAEPVTRRAMTPPPRAPPRYGGSNGGGGHRYYGSAQIGPGQRARGFSASGPGFRARAARKKLAPPQPLTNLPTPYLLKDDTAIFSAIEFAPPSSAQDRRAGRPITPFAEQRPYSPTVRPFTPLVSPFEDLAAMPSPHHLRKSGTFTGLDFKPPPRLKTGDSASDAGSIRSGRSNMSASQLANIRAGAYRVSRIPKQYVGTRDDMSENLRPTWDLRGPTPGAGS